MKTRTLGHSRPRHLEQDGAQSRRDRGRLPRPNLRREVLREHGGNGIPTVAPGFITTMANTALEAGYHVVMEGILHTGQNGTPLRELIAEHPGPSHVFWMDVGFDETLRRHAGRPICGS